MENAAKALLIAGGVLLAILIIVVAVYFYNNSASLNDRFNQRAREKEIQEFNAKFTQYENYDENGNKIPFTAQDVVSMVNFVKEYNKTHENSEQMEIWVYYGQKRADGNETFGGVKFEGKSDNDINKFLEEKCDIKFVFKGTFGNPSNTNNLDEEGKVKKIQVGEILENGQERNW